jgi:hypothetical protein
VVGDYRSEFFDALEMIDERRLHAGPFSFASLHMAFEFSMKSALLVRGLKASETDQPSAMQEWQEWADALDVLRGRCQRGEVEHVHRGHVQADQVGALAGDERTRNAHGTA